MSESLPLIFDVHLDLAMNAMEFNRDLRWSHERIRRRELGMKDLAHRSRHVVCFPEMRRGNVGLCVATQLARFVPYFGRMPGWSSPEQAWAHTQGQLAWYREMEACGEMRQIRDRAQLEEHLKLWPSRGAQPAEAEDRRPIGYILSLEGADSLCSLRHLERSCADGLRAIGLTHYGPGIYGHGTDDEGPLSSRGCELLKEIERLGLILDATHLCDESFWDAMKRYQGPVWASHSNCRSLARWNRQFDDTQIQELIRRGAVLGMAFDAIMMVHGWRWKESKPQEFNLKIEKICEHIDHICQLAGNARHVGIGTDLDGGYGTEQTPMDLERISDLQTLTGLLAARGYKPADIDGILHGNFLSFLRRVWK
jgi:membrane dipeptidase